MLQITLDMVLVYFSALPWPWHKAQPLIQHITSTLCCTTRGPLEGGEGIVMGRCYQPTTFNFEVK